MQDGRQITLSFSLDLAQNELEKIKSEIGSEAFANSRYEDAAKLMKQFISDDSFVEFITLIAYDQLD